MFTQLIRWWLKHHGKEYLIHFWDGVTQLGKPGDVSFPIELIEQGAGLVLSGLNNTLAIHSHLNWVWPFWVVKQQDPKLSDFIPTGVNTLTMNLSHRNWVSVGIPNFHLEAMVDPVGMFTPHAFGWSVFPYIRHHQSSYFPPLLSDHITQIINEDGSVCTTYTVSPFFTWETSIKA